jgi:hypothetical protein
MSKKLFLKPEDASPSSQEDAAHLHNTYAILESLRLNTGNCAEQAKIAGIFAGIMIENGLSHAGFTQHEINEANIKLSILETPRNGYSEGDHTICRLEFTANKENVSLYIDPWLHGAVFDEKDAPAVYAEHPNRYCNQNTDFEVEELQTEVINNEKTKSAVQEMVYRTYDIDLTSKNPLDNYIDTLQVKNGL